MTLKHKIAELPLTIGACKGNDAAEMAEDIYHYFSDKDQFEVLRIDRTSDPEKMVLAVCITTMPDPFFRIVVSHVWTNDLAFDNQWSEFEETEQGTVFRFLTWDDTYITGEIWFERARLEGLK